MAEADPKSLWLTVPADALSARPVFEHTCCSLKGRAQRRAKIRRLAFLAQLATCTEAVTVSFGFAEDDRIHQALKLITDTASQICQTAPLEETHSGIDLSGYAQAKVGDVIGKLVDSGF